MASVTTGLVREEEPPSRDAAGKAPGDCWDPLG